MMDRAVIFNQIEDLIPGVFNAFFTNKITVILAT